jgi:hypothetical protein
MEVTEMRELRKNPSITVRNSIKWRFAKLYKYVMIGGAWKILAYDWRSPMVQEKVLPL